MIKVQAQDFHPAQEIAALLEGKTDIGALVQFTGLVRVGQKGNAVLKNMTLEHYPGMTERALAKIEQEAQHRWDLAASLVIHRYGCLKVGEQIMMVATASAHRQSAFEAASFLMDFLKTEAPFWKYEEYVDPDGQTTGVWVEPRIADEKALDRWI